MVFVISGIFILALALTIATIAGTIIGSAPQISAAVAGRHGPVRGPRIIHIGAVQHTGIRHADSAQIITFKPRSAAAIDALPGAASNDLPLAA